eukprot:2263801-Amphidinium_carterae.2
MGSLPGPLVSANMISNAYEPEEFIVQLPKLRLKVESTPLRLNVSEKKCRTRTKCPSESKPPTTPHRNLHKPCGPFSYKQTRHRNMTLGNTTRRSATSSQGFSSSLLSP